MLIDVKILHNNVEQLVQVPRGTLLSDVLERNGPGFELPCGGKLICRRCQVQVTGEVSVPTEVELATFTPQELAQGFRLACATRAEGDVTIEYSTSSMYNIAIKGEGQELVADPLFQRYGIAVDIGTTTICVSLFDADGLIDSTAMKNPQAFYGLDVISRIESALAGKGEALQNAVCSAIKELLNSLLANSEIGSEEIDAAIITGNTTMLYLLVGQNPETLSHAPFIADRLFGEYVPAELLFGDLKINDDLKVYLPHCIAAFVGADITTAILASGICENNEKSLLVDIGTNGEMALWHDRCLYACSTAAGPAFEGGELSCGVPGIKGAIDHIWLENDNVEYSSLAGYSPIGICGSGIVDALSVMLKLEVIDETGAFQEGSQFDIAENVHVNQVDVRKMQLAKSAIRAGMETLIHIAGLDWQDIDHLYIAGGFGSYLNLESAADIGLIPPSVLNRTKVIGNAALTGASMMLLQQGLIETTEKLIENTQVVSLEKDPVFMEQYIENMLFSFN